jgi:hypothetical protein
MWWLIGLSALAVIVLSVIVLWIMVTQEEP